MPLFWRKCSCVESFQKPVYRFVNIVFKEGRRAPMIGKPHEWADRQCPHCHGDGVVLEKAETEKDVNAMFEDFKKKLARPA